MSCDTCRLALNTDRAPYIVPLSFGYEEREGKRIFYFHGAGEGRKIELLRKNNAAGFEADTACTILAGEKACGYTALYKSVIGWGRVEFLEDPKEKKRGLDIIMSHYSKDKEFEYSPELLERACVFRLIADEISCKEHI